VRDNILGAKAILDMHLAESLRAVCFIFEGTAGTSSIRQGFWESVSSVSARLNVILHSSTDWFLLALENSCLDGAVPAQTLRVHVSATDYTSSK